MKRRVIWVVLICVLVISLVLASCTKTSSITTIAPTSSITTTTTKMTITTAISSTSTTKITTNATTGNWWDKLGKPQYGGELTLRINRDIVKFDPDVSGSLMSMGLPWMDKLFQDDWTADPAVFNFATDFRPSNYVVGDLAKSWEFTDTNTFVIHLSQGIHWQDISPANGREFTADDVVFHYQRMFGLGSSMAANPGFASSSLVNMTSLNATDKYTVAFKWKTTNPEFIRETIMAGSVEQSIENPEAVKLWGNLNDWHHAIGTGPFILKDFVSGNSMVLDKNPNYFAHDERYPQNQLPYIDHLNVLIIPDNATALAALRTGKIDLLDLVSLQNSQLLQKTNPALVQLVIPTQGTLTIDPRNDVVPFKDIKVRQALQKAIDLPTIAKTYYGGTCSPDPSTTTSNYMTGWGFPYDQWPQDLKDSYAYDPTAAKQLLADAGYPHGFKTDIVADNAGDMDLLQIVKSYFSAIGVDMDIRPMDSAAWSSFVQINHKHDQMCQRSSGSLGNSYEPIRQLTRLTTNYSSNFAMVSDPIYDTFYAKALDATTVDEVKKILRDANEYVARQHFLISLLDTTTFTIKQPWLKGYNGQGQSLTGTIAGPFFLFDYGARFWIDQDLKKSMGGH